MIVSPETVCCPSPLRGDKGRHWPSAELIFRQSKKGCNHAAGQIVWHLHTTLMVVKNTTDFCFHKSPTKGRKHKQTITRHCENEMKKSDVDNKTPPILSMQVISSLVFNISRVVTSIFFIITDFINIIFTLKACLLTLYEHVVS